MRTQLVCLSILLAAMTFGSSGCLVLAVGAGAAGAVAYTKGDLEAEQHHNIDQVYAATTKAVEDLKLYVLSDEGNQDALSATVVARDAGDKRVKVTLKSVAQDLTKVSIRVGTFGDQTKQRLIYDKIRENLKAASAPAAQTPPPASPAPPAQPPAPTSSAPPAQTPPPTSLASPSQTPPASAAPAAQAPPGPCAQPEQALAGTPTTPPPPTKPE